MDPDSEFGRFVSRKYLVLVGPASTLEGSRSHDFIESHDLVIRVGRGHDIPPAEVPDLGRRTDILYHTLWFGHRPGGEREQFVAGIGAEVAWVCGAYPRLDLDHPHARDAAAFEAALGGSRRFRTVRLDRYLALFRRVLTRPGTGLSAIHDLLGFDIAELHVTGFTIAAPDSAQAHGSVATEEAVDFDREGQRPYLAALAAAEPRITFDSVLVEELEAPPPQELKPAE